MPNLSKIHLMGHVGRDAELKYSQNQTSILQFSLAVTHKNRSGGEDETNWFRCSVFGQRAEKLAPYIVKGTPLYVDGVFKHREYEKRDGGNGFSLDVKVDSLEFAGNKPQTNDDFRTQTPTNEDTPF